MTIKQKAKITTIKIKLETKGRLDHLKEFERESYDETIKKTLFILNALRNSPEVAQGILRNIDLKLKRKQQIYESIPEENTKTSLIQKKIPEKNLQEKRSEQERRILQDKFIKRNK